jgi:hypothetical protein
MFPFRTICKSQQDENDICENDYECQNDQYCWWPSDSDQKQCIKIYSKKDNDIVGWNGEAPPTFLNFV